MAKSCVTMTDLMIKTELSDFICEEFSKSSGKTSKANFEQKSVIKSPMQLRIFLQRSEYNFETNEYWKNKTKFACPDLYSMSFLGKHAEVIYILVYIKIHIGNDMYKSHYACDVLDYSTETWWNCDGDN